QTMLGDSLFRSYEEVRLAADRDFTGSFSKFAGGGFSEMKMIAPDRQSLTAGPTTLSDLDAVYCACILPQISTVLLKLFTILLQLVLISTKFIPVVAQFLSVVFNLRRTRALSKILLEFLSILPQFFLIIANLSTIIFQFAPILTQFLGRRRHP